MSQNRGLVLAIPVSGVAFWDALVSELRVLGHSVEVWSSVEDGAYRCRGGGLSSLLVRLRMAVYFPVSVILRAVWHRRCKDWVLVVPTTPFYLPALAALFSKVFRLRVVHLLYDLYPEVLILAGKVAVEGCVARCFAKFTAYALRHCEATVFLGERLRTVAEDRYGKARHGYIIEVGADGRLFGDVQTARPNLVRVLYAGNMGYAHDVNTLVRLFENPLPAAVELVFHASGVGYTRLKERFAARNESTGSIKWGGPLSVKKWESVMQGAHVGLVTMSKEAEDVLFPSKTYSAMLAGQAILGVCAESSDLARTVREADCGWIVKPGDSAGLARVLAEVANDREGLMVKRRNAQTYARAHFDMSVIARKWSAMLDELSSSRRETN